MGTPSATAYLSKGRESVWINAYPRDRKVVVAYPAVQLAPGAEAVGVVREIPTRDEIGAVRRFCAEVRRHREDEWTDRSAAVAVVWSADPWDITDPLTAPCPF